VRSGSRRDTDARPNGINVRYFAAYTPVPNVAVIADLRQINSTWFVRFVPMT